MISHRAGGSAYLQSGPLRIPGALLGNASRLCGVLVIATVLTGCQSGLFRPSSLPSPTVANAEAETGATVTNPSMSAAKAAPSSEQTESTGTDDAASPAEVAATAQAKLPPPPPKRLLQRIRDGFSLPIPHHSKTFKREVHWFAAHPEYLDRVFNRARPYLYYIVSQLDKRDMPTELALLPVIESAFDPFAYSSGRASGLWQIIPGTARMMDVRQNWWFDGRRDLIASTRGALDYLSMLSERFDGDWLLAIAGYNSGGGAVSRAIRRADKAGRDTDFAGIRRYLPRQTRTYVPRLLAICAIVAHPEDYHLTLPKIPNTPQIAIVNTGGQIDMARAAKLAGIDVDALYQLNPGVNRWATDPNGEHRLVLPIGDAKAFEAALAQLGDRHRVEWTRYEIQPGDSLIAIANQFTTTPDVLRHVNDIDGNLIRAGHYLMIPHASAALASYTESSAARLARKQGQEREGTRHVHTVRKGDSLWSISQRYDVNVSALAKWNGMAPHDTLSIGRKLVIWTQGGNEQATRVTAVRQQGPDDRIQRVRYRVRSGDSLARIAQRFRVSVNDLLNWNDDLSRNRYLQPGQQVVLFVDVTQQST